METPKKPEEMSDADWKEQLTPEQFHVCREGGTEMPFTGALLKNKEDGTYSCVACGNQLFDSETKFESGTGWPSFDEVMNSEAVELIEDTSLGMTRTEVRCAKCAAHLGHLFNDGPTATGKRYCINSVALDFAKKSE